MLRLAVVVCLIALPLRAEPRTIAFAPTDQDFPNPERGWWLYAASDFAEASDADIAAVIAEGMTVVYGIVRLDAYRNSPLPPDLLTGLDENFARARQHGVKIILRFAYNYPDNSFDYESAEDAPLPQVLDHIEQLAPVIAANADTILVMQAGFIGAWGEGHSSSNGLDTPEAKAAIRDALYAAIPAAIPLQWRYPEDILSWTGDSRMGLHNDCFLSSPTDVGTYSEAPAARAAERAAMADLTDRHVFTGETCDADAESARLGCAAILAEGAEFHLTALNRHYYEAFHRSWRAEGCLHEVGLRMGYRLRLVDLRLDDEGALALRIANDGWARPVQPGSLLVTAYSDGRLLGQTRLDGSLDEIGAGETVTLSGTLAQAAAADRLCLAAPDRSPRLAGDPRQAIRFANADGPGQSWEPDRAAFCIALNWINAR
ncbi:MAG: DUF4874 domain-containing protein [Tabrizicola sp.]